MIGQDEDQRTEAIFQKGFPCDQRVEVLYRDLRPLQPQLLSGDQIQLRFGTFHLAPSVLPRAYARHKIHLSRSLALYVHNFDQPPDAPLSRVCLCVRRRCAIFVGLVDSVYFAEKDIRNRLILIPFSMKYTELANPIHLSFRRRAMVQIKPKSPVIRLCPAFSVSENVIETPMKTVYVPHDVPHDVWREVSLHLRSEDVCAFRAVNRETARVIIPFVPHTLGPLAHCVTPNITGHEGELDVLLWMTAQKEVTYDFSDCLDVAAEYGHLEIVQWLHFNRREGCSTEAMDRAAKHGYLEVVQWLHDNRDEGCSTKAMDGASGNGHLEVVHWLHKHRSEGCTKEAMDNAATSGDLEMLRWLHAHRREGCTIEATMYAARNGHLGVLKWLYANRPEGKEDIWCAIDIAAKYGDIDILRWMHRDVNDGCMMNAMDYAAIGGQLETVKWLHANVAEDECCTTTAMDYAAMQGDLDMVRWLHMHRTEGCTCRAMEDAAKNGHIDVVRWLYMNRKPQFEDCMQMAIDYASKNGHVDVVQWLEAKSRTQC